MPTGCEGHKRPRPRRVKNLAKTLRRSEAADMKVSSSSNIESG